jgi:hypothetical protein
MARARRPVVEVPVEVEVEVSVEDDPDLAPLADPAADPGPLTDEEHQALEESLIDVVEITKEAWAEHDQPIVDAAVAIETELPVPTADELRVLRPDQLPAVGQHYVIFQGIPRPVQRTVTMSEDEYTRSIGTVPDPTRRVRADRTLRLRYRGYLCGEIASL